MQVLHLNLADDDVLTQFLERTRLTQFDDNQPMAVLAGLKVPSVKTKAKVKKFGLHLMVRKFEKTALFTIYFMKLSIFLKLDQHLLT